MLNYDLSKRNGKSKTRYLYECIREDIRSGMLFAGERLPSKRELAAHLHVSVITVENAYIMLEEEGYVRAKPGSGFFVGSGFFTKKTDPGKSEFVPLPEEGGFENGAGGEDAYFPAMARTVRKVLSERPEILTRKSPVFGCAVLRNALAAFLRRYRGMEVQPSDIIVGAGSEYLYGLIVLFFGPSFGFAIESPSYEKIEKVYRASGAIPEHLEMGEDGIRSDALKRTKAKVLHVTPYHSYPTGVTAPAAKRFEYLAWAEACGGYIIEDDFDSEFAFYRKPIETLYAMDRAGRVIYMNTFTKSLSGAVRTAYMILPEGLREKYAEKLGFYSCPVPVLDQYVLADYIESGAFERHLGRRRRAEKQPSASNIPDWTNTATGPI